MPEFLYGIDAKTQLVMNMRLNTYFCKHCSSYKPAWQNQATSNPDLAKS
jgi:hypothetical protein